MDKIRVAFLAVIILLNVMGKRSFAEDWGATARGVFAKLPTSIFESVPTDLSENDKLELLSEGQSEYWGIASETPDELIFASRPFQDRVIALRLFRNGKDGTYEVAVGTLREPVCSLELWHIDISGRITPADTPEEPEIKEFFAGNRKFPPRIKHDVQLCIDERGLRALPIFWNDQGMLPAKLENEIVYSWNGDRFRKRTRPKQYMVPIDAER